MKKLIRVLIGALWVTLARAEDAKKVDFVKEIQPILRENCIKCHGPDKQKGKLRLDSREAAFKGGTDGLVITAGAADKSDLFRRISLPATHDDFMPSKGDPLTQPQIALIKDWINQGAVWPEEAIAKEPEATPSPFARLVEIKTSAAEQKAVDKLSSLGMPVQPIAMNMTWREVNLGLKGTNVTDQTLLLLKDMPSLVSLNLAGTAITDAGLANLKPLGNLTRLHLENTKITDAGLANLSGLINLNYLNLYGTAITDAGLHHLVGLTNLSHIYLWQTKVTDAGATNLQQAVPKLDISRGGDLTVLAKKEEKKEDVKKEEPKQEEPKK